MEVVWGVVILIFHVQHISFPILNGFSVYIFTYIRVIKEKKNAGFAWCKIKLKSNSFGVPGIELIYLFFNQEFLYDGIRMPDLIWPKLEYFLA